MITVWEGTYTDRRSGFETHVIIRVDGDKLAKWFGKSQHSNTAFCGAKSGRKVVQRLEGGIVITLDPALEGSEDNNP